MKKRLFGLMLCLAGLFILCTGCAQKEEATTEATTEEASTEAPEEKVKQASLFIGRDGEFTRYYWQYKGELTPRRLIRGLEKTTGWNLTLDKRVTKREDGYIICFNDSSDLYHGQRLDKDDEFYIPYKEHFYETILDSIEKTLRYHYKKKGKDFHIYYWGEGDKTLFIDETKQSVSMTEPYDGLKQVSKSKVTGSEAVTVYDVEGIFQEMKDDERFSIKVDGKIKNYQVRYASLRSILKGYEAGRKVKMQITEDMISGEKLVTKIY